MLVADHGSTQFNTSLADGPTDGLELSRLLMSTTPSVVCVTGASGFIASHIVSQLLEKGFTVRGTVRDASDEAHNGFLRALPGAAERLSLFSADLSTPDAFDEAVAGCDGVIHTATPIIKTDDRENQVFAPAIAGLRNVLSAVDKAGTVKTFVLTSSMAAMAPKPEPAMRDESHWSNSTTQKEAKNWYGACKTCQVFSTALLALEKPGISSTVRLLIQQEQLAVEWAAQHPEVCKLYLAGRVPVRRT